LRYLIGHFANGIPIRRYAEVEQLLLGSRFEFVWHG